MCKHVFSTGFPQDGSNTPPMAPGAELPLPPPPDVDAGNENNAAPSFPPNFPEFPGFPPSNGAFPSFPPPQGALPSFPPPEGGPLPSFPPPEGGPLPSFPPPESGAFPPLPSPEAPSLPTSPVQDEKSGGDDPNNPSFSEFPPNFGPFPGGNFAIQGSQIPETDSSSLANDGFGELFKNPFNTLVQNGAPGTSYHPGTSNNNFFLSTVIGNS